MKSWVWLLSVSVLVAPPARAEDDLLQSYRAPMDACWAGVHGDPERAGACNGVLAEACMNNAPGGMSNLGMSQCTYAEAAFWDEKLNEAWGTVIALLREADAQSRELEPGYAVREDRLRAAERAWIAFRDAECEFDYSIYGSGSMRQLMHPSCMSQMTYERVRDLLGIAAEFGI